MVNGKKGLADYASFSRESIPRRKKSATWTRTRGRAPQEIIQYLFDHDKALDVARSIAAHGYFENEPLLAVFEGSRYVVVEGNRRLAALKALKAPGLLTSNIRKQVERLVSQTDSTQFPPFL